MDVDSIAGLLNDFADLPGVGVDVELVDRFGIADPRLFTPSELEYCEDQPVPAESRAGRWCAKEAAVKACAKYIQLSPREIEIANEPSGRPVALLSDRAAALGLSVAVSIAHSGNLAIAVAVAGMKVHPSHSDS
jgi:phosphopantetheine--protein transferase-like protein